MDDEKLKQIKQTVRDNVRFETVNPPKSGGQTVMQLYTKQRLYSEELDLTIEFAHYRSPLKIKN